MEGLGWPGVGVICRPGSGLLVALRESHCTALTRTQSSTLSSKSLSYCVVRTNHLPLRIPMTAEQGWYPSTVVGFAQCGHFLKLLNAPQLVAETDMLWPTAVIPGCVYVWGSGQGSGVRAWATDGIQG